MNTEWTLHEHYGKVAIAKLQMKLKGENLPTKRAPLTRTVSYFKQLPLYCQTSKTF